jgi:signal transduction histidine kinase
MDFNQWCRSMSLVSRGVRNQFAVAIVLMSLIPLAILVFLIVEVIPNNSLPTDALNLIALWAFVLAFLGWRLLVKYPINIIRLRRYLDALAKGEIPRQINIEKGESDLFAIEQNMNRIILQTEERIHTLENHMQILLETERQRVLLESLGAACHHLGQPTTVLVTSLQIMKHQDLSPDLREMVEACAHSSHEIMEILHKLQGISVYKTEPYLTSDTTHDPSKDRILKI